jgi:hypothetical protein
MAAILAPPMREHGFHPRWTRPALARLLAPACCGFDPELLLTLATLMVTCDFWGDFPLAPSISGGLGPRPLCRGLPFIRTSQTPSRAIEFPFLLTFAVNSIVVR